MEQGDIKEIIRLLKQAKRTDDWYIVQEAIEYLNDFDEEFTEEDEEI